jgi:GNAT superfamily N-acetyltransferase
MAIEIRPLGRNDVPAAVRLKDQVGWNQTGADWEFLLQASPEGCFAAQCEGRVVGTAATIVYEKRVAWVGMVVVDPGYRGQGIGTSLLERAIRYLDDRRTPTVKLDATPHGKPLYEKFGFVAEYPIERWMLARSLTRPAPLEPLEEIGDVLSLDREAFGVDRGELLRALAERAPHLTLAKREDRSVVGYAFGRRGSRADQLGPWMARSERVAAALLDEFLNRSERDLIFVDCLVQNPWPLPLLKTRGFEPSRPLTRMVRGPNTRPGRPELLGAILGPEFG